MVEIRLSRLLRVLTSQGREAIRQERANRRYERQVRESSYLSVGRRIADAIDAGSPSYRRPANWENMSQRERDEYARSTYMRGKSGLPGV